MPIKVTCACGQSFAANDALAGKRVKCPKCAQPLQIPGGAAAAPGAPRPPAGAAATQQPRAQQQPAAPAPASNFGSVFDEVGLKAQSHSGPTCPNCRAPLAPEAILCVQCGFNRKLGRVMQTVTTSGGMGAMPAAGGHGGHGGGVASTLMEKAAQAIAEEEESERTKTSEGFPWYGYLAMLLGALGFMAVMRMVPHDSAIMVSALVVAFAGYLIALYANIRILIAAFTESIGHGLGCLLCGWYQLYYVITRWDSVGGYFLMGFGASFVAGLAFGAASAAAAFKSEPQEDASILRSRPAFLLVDATLSQPIALTRVAHG